MEALQSTLRSVAESKALQMVRQQTRFNEGRTTLQHLLECEPQGLQRLKTVLAAYHDLPLMEQPNNDTKTFITNLKAFMAQATSDPSPRTAEWEKRLMRLLNTQSLQYKYSVLYTDIMKEWMRNSDEPEIGDDINVVETEDLAPSKSAFRSKWESYVFNALDTDQHAINAWLGRLFRKDEFTARALGIFRKIIAKFEKSLLSTKEHFTELTMNWCVEGLLRSDLLTDDKRAVLAAINQDSDALTDLRDDLNMRMSTLDRWAWPEEGVPAETRRQVGTKYRIFHDEDIMDALLLRYIGVKWSVKISKTLTAFSEATWLSPTITSLSKKEQERREHYFGPRKKPTSLSSRSPSLTRSTSSEGQLICQHCLGSGMEFTSSPCDETEVESSGRGRHLESRKKHVSGLREQRRDTYVFEYFLNQLLRADHEVDRGYEDVEEQAEGLTIRKSATERKHRLLQLLATEVAIGKRLNDEITVLQSDFKSFGPSIPHSTISAVLVFFGVSPKWIQFFQKALEIPVIFKEDGPNASVRVRRRGTPMSSPLADVFGELMLFCMDFSVYNATGLYLYRLHDDFWLWGSEKSCSQGWKVINDFAKVMGLELNAEKSGCVRISHTGPHPHQETFLPQGDVTYGFMKLSPTTGYFTPVRNLVNAHTVRLISQLTSCKSLFAFIRIWNVYGVGYFMSMLGGNQLANCFGAQHVTEMQSLFARVYIEVFRGVFLTGRIQKMIKDRFPSFTDKVLEPFIFLPVELGGLGVQNPFIVLGQLRKIAEDPELVMTNFFKAETAAYAKSKAAFEKRAAVVSTGGDPARVEAFLSFPEYIQGREKTSLELLKAYRTLLKRTTPERPQVSDQVMQMIGGAQAVEGYSSYILWNLEIYKDELVRNFGGLRIVDRRLLPMGMVKMARRQRIKWTV
ncbi:MAG: hypothetical protein Q9170_003333 [Blastenia crenularia]